MRGRCRHARVVVPVRLAREHVAAVHKVAVVLLDHAVKIVVDPQRVVGVVRDVRPVEVLRAEAIGCLQQRTSIVNVYNCIPLCILGCMYTQRDNLVRKAHACTY